MRRIKSFFRFFFPPDRWMRSVVMLLGIFVGLVAFIVYISNAGSYLSDQPETCINCHVMYPQYASWSHSSHRNDAVCNDCHVPQNAVANKYYFKAKDGLRHAAMFTLRLEPQVIRMHDAGEGVVQENCKRCHADLVSMINLTEVTAENAEEGKGHKCWDCHIHVPHGEVRSLSSHPFALVAKEKKVVPAWLEEHLNAEKNNSTQK